MLISKLLPEFKIKDELLVSRVAALIAVELTDKEPLIETDPVY